MDPATWLTKTTGTTLTAVTEARHRLGGETLLHFWLHFDGPDPTQFHGAGDTLVLKTGNTPYFPYDMSEYGTVRVGPAEAPSPLAAAVGRRLLGGRALRSGLLLQFEGAELSIESIAGEWVLSVARQRG